MIIVDRSPSGQLFSKLRPRIGIIQIQLMRTGWTFAAARNPPQLFFKIDLAEWAMLRIWVFYSTRKGG